MKDKQNFYVEDSHLPQPPSQDERAALMKLRDNSNIVIKEADKRGAIIIMKKEQYKNMVTQHLQSNVYEREHDRNADTKVMKTTENLTEKYSDVLEEHETEYLTEFRPSTSNFYLLPKVHKSKIIANLVEEKSVEYLKIENPPELPSRPIVEGLTDSQAKHIFRYHTPTFNRKSNKLR